MASHIVEPNTLAAEVVEHFHSPVVEAIILASSLTAAQPFEYVQEDSTPLMQELSAESLQFIEWWKDGTDWVFYHPLELLLRCPCFHDIEQFANQVAKLTDEDYVYHFFGGEIAMEIVQEIVRDPAKLLQLGPHLLWENDQKRMFIQHFLTELPYYRTVITKLLIEIVASRTFTRRFAVPISSIQGAVAQLQSLEMEPLALAQYVMGKIFRRVSPYKLYCFIPSYYLTPRRIRIFNKTSCIVIYGSAAPISQSREKSILLESQLKALADRNRLQILRLLAGQKLYGAKLAEYLSITTATVSHHLDILKKAGFVQEEKIGTIKYFSCDEAFAASTLEDLQQFLVSRKPPNLSR